MEIGKLIKEKRIEKNLTQEELAQEFFVTRQLVSKWENGKSYPDLDQAVKLSDYFDLSLDELLRGDTAMRKELQFDTKRKKWFKVIIFFLTLIVSLFVTYNIYLWKINPTVLTKEDMLITKVEKRILPEEKVLNQKTGEMINLPQDVEYTIYFKTDRPFVNLASRSGVVVTADPKILLCQVYAERVLWGGNKESKMVIYSRRGYDYLNADSNLERDIYIYNPEKNPTREQMRLASPDFSLAYEGDLLYSADELEKLPVK